jgi:hypothetical protein
MLAGDPISGFACKSETYLFKSVPKFHLALRYTYFTVAGTKRIISQVAAFFVLRFAFVIT